MKQKFFLGLDSKSFHRVAYWQWGTKNSTPIICVHGLTGDGHSFDVLAQQLETLGYFVACPDVPGRGDSDWLANPDEYNYPVYLNDMTALIARLDCESVGWIGTSMGGIMGMTLASLPRNPIQYLVLNDIGPFISAESIKRIQVYSDKIEPVVFENLDAAQKYFKETYGVFDYQSDEEWRRAAQLRTRKNSNGKLSLKMDPAIKINPSSKKIKDVDLWNIWEKVKCPVLVLRGAESDVLTKETVEKMKQINPKCDSVEIPDAGHAPVLTKIERTTIIADWLKTHHNLNVFSS